MFNIKFLILSAIIRLTFFGKWKLLMLKYLHECHHVYISCKNALITAFSSIRQARPWKNWGSEAGCLWGNEVISFTLEANWKSELRWRGQRLWLGPRTVLLGVELLQSHLPSEGGQSWKRWFQWQVTSYNGETACCIRLLSIKVHVLFNPVLCMEPLLQAYLNTSALSQLCCRARPFIQKQLFTEAIVRLPLPIRTASFNSGLYFFLLSHESP